MDEIITLREDHIKLGQALKVCNAVSSGAESKIVINEGLVSVNGEICTMRGKKLYDGDIVDFEEYHIIIKK